MSKIKVVIGGINGRFGRASAKAITESLDLELTGAFGRDKANYVGKPIASLIGLSVPAILVSNAFSEIVAQGISPDVYLDFTEAETAVENAKFALQHGIRPVIGTSGLSETGIRELSQLAANQKIGALIVPNFSVGAVLMMEFAKMAGRFFPNVEIVEMHHTKKVDAPSGTAMYTAKKLASTGVKFNHKEVNEKELLPGARGAEADSGVRVHSLRLPGLISHQEVILGSDGELLTIRHDGLNANCYLKGILMALKAVVGMNQMHIGLESLLGLSSN